MAESKYPKWTDGRYRAFITSGIRSAFRRYPPKYEAIKSAFTKRKKNKASGREAAHFLCAECKGEFPQTGIQVDHIVPVVGHEGFVSWDSFIDRMFCPVENLQILCKACHKVKTAKEKKDRK